MSFSKVGSFDSDVNIRDLPIDKGYSTFFWYLYQNRISTDVIFLLETLSGYKEFHAHKLLLSLMSPYFAERFYKDGKATKQVEKIILKEIDQEAFEEMMGFMYKGTSPQLKSPKQACGLFKIAGKFEVTSLVKECNQFLNQMEVEPSNVFTFLEVAEYVQNQSLTDRCFALVQGKTREVMNAYALSDITTSMLHIILDLPTLSLTSEYELLKWVFSWGNEKASQENSPYSNIREVLQKILPDMHFLELSNVEFTEICRDYDGFFTSDEVASILMNIAIPGSKQMPEWYPNNCSPRVYPKQIAKGNLELKKVEESCLNQNDTEDVEPKQSESEENKSEQNESEENKLEQTESEEAKDEQMESEENKLVVNENEDTKH